MGVVKRVVSLTTHVIRAEKLPLPLTKFACLICLLTRFTCTFINQYQRLQNM